MILFLDVVSPCPKFVLIDNDKDKIIQSIHILDQNITKISDSLLSKYLILEKKYELFNKIECGQISPQKFLKELSKHCPKGTKIKEIKDAWNAIIGPYEKKIIPLMNIGQKLQIILIN